MLVKLLSQRLLQNPLSSVLKHFLYLLLFVLTSGLPHAQAQVFDRLYSNSVQPLLSQPLQWVSTPSAAAPDLLGAFTSRPEPWAFAPYTAQTVLPTTTGQDVWVKFTLAGTPEPKSWVIRIPRLTVQKVSLYSLDANGFWTVQSAGASIAQRDWNRSTRTPSFEVLTSPAEKTYFLRFEHSIPITERPELISQTDFSDGAGQVGGLIGMMLGMFGMLFVACLAVFGVARNTVFISLAAFTAATLLHYLVQIGFGSWRIWPGSAHLNQTMPWVAPLLAMAACCWFFAQASYAKDSNRLVYRLLCVTALASFGLGVLKLINGDQVNRSLLNAWSVCVVVVIVFSLLWLSLRVRRWNLWLLGGLLPIVAAGATRVPYNYGWLSHIESAHTASVFLTQAGLAWLFMALVWRSRTSLLSAQVASALENSDPVTGLVRERVAQIRLPQMLKRANQLKLGCGVIMLQWLNYSKLMRKLSPEEQQAMLKQLGLVLNRVARDIDTAARLNDGYFMILVEGPISRSTLASLSTQILTACIRSSDKFDLPNSFNFHIAIWQAALVPSSADEVTEALRTRLNQMSFGTKRPVQFIDVATSDVEAQPNQEFNQRRDDLLAKIDAIEASPSVRAVLRPDKPRK